MTGLCMICAHLRAQLHKQSQYQFLQNEVVFTVSETKKPILWGKGVQWKAEVLATVVSQLGGYMKRKDLSKSDK